MSGVRPVGGTPPPWLGSDASAVRRGIGFGELRGPGENTPLRFRVDRVQSTWIRIRTEPYIYRLGGLLNLSGLEPTIWWEPNGPSGRSNIFINSKKVLRFPLVCRHGGGMGGNLDDRSLIRRWSSPAFGREVCLPPLDTGLGPIYLAYSQASAGVRRVSLTIGVAL
jgi:hypothetical protein